jgi:hypothetical protein
VNFISQERDVANGQDTRRFRNPGKMSLNRGLVALAVAVGGYLIGFRVTGLSHQGQAGAGGGWSFWPIGGVFALFMAIMAIQIGRKTRRFIDKLPAPRRERVGNFMDLELERKRATAGVALGIIAIAANPLIGFLVLLIVRR